MATHQGRAGDLPFTPARKGDGRRRDEYRSAVDPSKKPPSSARQESTFLVKPALLLPHSPSSIRPGFRGDLDPPAAHDLEGIQLTLHPSPASVPQNPTQTLDSTSLLGPQESGAGKSTATSSTSGTRPGSGGNLPFTVGTEGEKRLPQGSKLTRSEPGTPDEPVWLTDAAAELAKGAAKALPFEPPGDQRFPNGAMARHRMQAGQSGFNGVTDVLKERVAAAVEKGRELEPEPEPEPQLEPEPEPEPELEDNHAPMTLPHDSEERDAERNAQPPRESLPPGSPPEGDGPPGNHLEDDRELQTKPDTHSSLTGSQGSHSARSPPSGRLPRSGNRNPAAAGAAEVRRTHEISTEHQAENGTNGADGGQVMRLLNSAASGSLLQPAPARRTSGTNGAGGALLHLPSFRRRREGNRNPGVPPPPGGPRGPPTTGSTADSFLLDPPASSDTNGVIWKKIKSFAKPYPELVARSTIQEAIRDAYKVRYGVFLNNYTATTSADHRTIQLYTVGPDTTPLALYRCGYATSTSPSVLVLVLQNKYRALRMPADLPERFPPPPSPP